ncbi:MAG: CDP-diacylglycerol--glycerol-3-phosphate 3-phosphatidyltransferase [Gordonia sp.]|uniref:CDP-diacylglycerol--glycerol-3-phosphate 3-phosphatidyltransferase n=1 Tax=Gordonia sp. (in: high G+C Gram-positive bacteria) TaxID=84139 RepID=UPI000C582682|nr:CDP-diacylglycerol--glycerol-3-phosphate 3-phosphatidyltransferase [Gordonia sp. (in: high G+C Gram-positive bacteria)]MAU82899.1 CDP-diacylglycerol--glycerol-3-phosphate 3-phosphatidyltransferase [Gordonia sp. (in: high G+C Gram-positive bacteria)]
MTDRVRRAVEESGLANAGRGPDHITDPVDPVPVVNIANALTVFRIVLVPVFIVALFLGGGHDTGWRIAAAVIFGIAAITDRYDGRLARERGLVTDFGKMVDPIADKALIGSALVGLSILGDLSWWVTIVILIRELGVTALRFWVLRHGVIPASRGGKLKTLLQAVAIGLYLLPLAGLWHVAAAVTMGTAVIATVFTGGDYVWQALVLRRRSLAGRTDEGRARTPD